jgi:hypothetical protein
MVSLVEHRDWYNGYILFHLISQEIKSLIIFLKLNRIFVDTETSALINIKKSF